MIELIPPAESAELTLSARSVIENESFIEVNRNEATLGLAAPVVLPTRRRLASVESLITSEATDPVLTVMV